MVGFTLICNTCGNKAIFKQISDHIDDDNDTLNVWASGEGQFTIHCQKCDNELEDKR